MTFKVYGVPVPKGSARGFVVPGKDGGRARAVVVQTNKKPLAHWQTQVANEARVALKARERNQQSFGAELPPLDFDGPIAIDAAFYFNRPKSAKRQHPTVKPDLDKLVRAILDALTGVIWRDDSQVVFIEARKSYLDHFGGASEYAEITVENRA